MYLYYVHLLKHPPKASVCCHMYYMRTVELSGCGRGTCADLAYLDKTTATHNVTTAVLMPYTLETSIIMPLYTFMLGKHLRIHSIL